MILSLATLATAGEFMDVWVTTAFEDGNVLAGPSGDSPSPNFVERGNSTFFENYERRYTDDITQSWLALYRKDEGFHPRIFTEAAFVLRFNPWLDPDDSDPGIDIADDGSYVRVGYKLGEDEDHAISLTGYAVDANRFRLGYSYDLTWGGRNIYVGDPSAAPGARLQYQNGETYAFAGLKTAVFDYDDPESDETGLEEAYYGGLVGAGAQLGERVRVEAGAGSFQQGQLVAPNVNSAINLDPINAIGGCAQIAFRTNPELDWITSGELRLVRNEPDQVKETYISHRELDGVGVLVQAEWNVLAHNLIDFEEVDSTVVEKAMAGDVQALLVAGTTEVAVDFVYKDLNYIVFNVPGLTSGYATPESVTPTPQIYVRGQLSHYFPEAHLTPSIGAGWMRAATYGSGDSYIIVQDEANRYHVPDGQLPTALLSSVAGVQWDISRSTIAVGEVLYTLNNNESVSGDEGYVLAPDNERNQLGFNLFVRSRF
ncbi:MAG: hypothetical protein ACOZNI_09165 [Myxococcota bacterium]